MIQTDKEENKRLRELLKETMMAMCDYRTMKGYCAKCNTSPYCLAKKIIPKVEKELNIQRKDRNENN